MNLYITVSISLKMYKLNLHVLLLMLFSCSYVVYPAQYFTALILSGDGSEDNHGS